MTEKEKMLAGELYIANDPELVTLRKRSKRLVKKLNRKTIFDVRNSERIIRRIFGSVGKNATVERPFTCDYGVNIYAGENLFINYNCVILDVCKVSIGNNVFIAPNVSIYTAEHPIAPEIRNTQLECGKPITIGHDVWIGGNVVINPGVTIGSNVVIGSGSVVTRDIPDNCIAAGNPCIVKREITPEQKEYWNSRAERWDTDDEPKL